MVKNVIVTISHENLISSVSGIAETVISDSGTVGVNIFIPIRSPETFINLIKV